MEQWATVILAAGQGARMKSALPKVLHPVAGRAILSYVAQAVSEAGVGPIVLVLPPNSEIFRHTVGAEVPYAVQSQPRGTGDALRCARPQLDRYSSVLVVSGDTPLLSGATLRRLVAHHRATDATISLLTTHPAEPRGLGRVIRDGEGRVQAVIEEAGADAAQRAIRETNAGAYCFDAAWLWSHLEALEASPQGEVYLTDLIGQAAAEGRRVEGLSVDDASEALGVNDRIQLAQAEAVLRDRIRRRWMSEGVTLIDPASTYIDDAVVIGRDTVIHPNTHVLGNSQIGDNCILGPNSIIVDSTIAENCLVQASVVEDATLEPDVTVGPFSHLRPQAYLERRVHIGNFAEIKNSRVGADTQMGHFSYVGDAVLGREVNVGAGTITCNFDGVEKHQTTVGDEVFLGSDTLLIAPVSVGDRAATGAGAVVTEDVPPDTLAVGVPARHRPRLRA